MQDVNNDHYIDIILAGNDFTMNPYLGRMDAGNGMVLLNDRNGSFIPQLPAVAGFYVAGNAKSLAGILINNNLFTIATQNSGPVKVFKQNTNVNLIKINSDDKFLTMEFADGKKQKQEFYFGNSFQSQSSRFARMYDDAKKIMITNSTAKVKVIK